MATTESKNAGADSGPPEPRSESHLPLLWKKVDVGAKAVAGVAIPLALAWLGNVQQDAQAAQREADRIVELQAGLSSSNRLERRISLITVDVLTKTGSIPEEFQAAVIGAALFEEDSLTQALAEGILQKHTPLGVIAAEHQSVAIGAAYAQGGAARENAEELLSERTRHSVTSWTPPDFEGPRDSVDFSISAEAADLTVSEFVDETTLARLRSKAVLWVDDLPANNAALRTTMASAGLRVDTATSTRDALSALERRPDGSPYDLVISDMGRNGRPRAGYELISGMKSRGIGVPVLIYSVSSTPEQHDQDARDAGAVGQVTTPTALLGRVREILRLSAGDP